MGDARQYCLKWNNHPRNVATVFDRCLHHPDLIIVVVLFVNIGFILTLIVEIINDINATATLILIIITL